MRPVDRGDPPRDYTAYGDAVGDLEDRLGRYCSYCERRFPSQLAVEHVSPKSLDEERETDWTNFLLACTSCNSVKGDTPTNDSDYVWPDKDNTLRAIDYKDGGFVEPIGGLEAELEDRARNLIELVGLDRHPGQPQSNRPAARDVRYMDREEVWALANKNLASLDRADCDELRETITDVAKGFGFFGVWMSVFQNDANMRKRLIKAFTGTALDCFDEDGNCIERPGGDI